MPGPSLTYRRRSTIENETFPAFGLRFRAGTLDGAVAELLRAPSTGRRLRAHFCTAHMVVEASKNAVLHSALRCAEMVNPDGMPLVWLGRRKGFRVERVYGPDVMERLMDRSRELGQSHFLYGGAPGVPEALKARLEARFPGVSIAGTYSPPFRPLTEEEDRAVVEMINAARPDFLWVGLSTPKQDLWATGHRARLNAAAILCVGAAFDFHSGRKPKAPRWMQKNGLEWFFRLCTEPRRLWRRYTLVNAEFLYLVLRHEARSLIRRRKRG